MKLPGLKCTVCGDTIYSRVRHDFHWCSCRGCFVDGGQDYFRYGGENFETTEVDVDVSMWCLYDDWNTGKNKYGRISSV